MIDAHCHIDRYKDPLGVAGEADLQGVFTVAVTNLPSHFEEAWPRVRYLKSMRLALGLHPLAASAHERELPLFARLLPLTSFVGEIGLDLSREGRCSAKRQVSSFCKILGLIAGARRFISLHSRNAEEEVTRLLRDYKISGAVFHWYSGPRGTLSRLLDDGHYLSINPAMVSSSSGQQIIRLLPQDRVLTESDGPYVTVRRVAAKPGDVEIAERYLAKCWNTSLALVRERIRQNFCQVAGQSVTPWSPMGGNVDGMP